MLAIPLASALARGRGQRRAGAIHGLHGFAVGGQVQGEAAGGGEAIERLAAAGVMGGGAVVLALVEEDAGLLAVQQVGVHGEAVHADGDGVGHLARQDRGFERQLLFGADGNIVARDNAARLEDLRPGRRRFRLWRRPCPGRASARPGSRHSGRRPARAAGRLRHGLRGRRRCHGGPRCGGDPRRRAGARGRSRGRFPPPEGTTGAGRSARWNCSARCPTRGRASRPLSRLRRAGRHRGLRYRSRRSTGDRRRRGRPPCGSRGRQFIAWPAGGGCGPRWRGGWRTGCPGRS